MARKTKPARSSRSSGEVGEERRAQLLAAAFEIVAQKGLEGLRTRDVVDRAGVNVSTLHYYFGTKDALLVALVEYVRDKFATAGRSFDDTRPWSESSLSLRAHFESSMHSFRSTPGLSTVLQELVQRGRRDPVTRAAFEGIHRDWAAVVERVLRAGIERGELRADLDPVAGSRIVTSFVMGAAAQLEVAPEAFDFDALARELERWVARM
ncbi:TetR/AcrR family transcriptional regulator [Nannocystaceae bacterium ST9]